MTQDQEILQSWRSNAAAWITTIANSAIESRRLVTNAAIIAAIADHAPQSLLDLGCGEGWLCREAGKTIKSLKRIVGLDAVPALIASAAAHSIGRYHVKGYHDIIAGGYDPGTPFDIITFNFSLFENETVEQLFKKIRPFVTANGKLIIQTLHPRIACGDMPYQDGWRTGSWNGFSSQFKDPAPWYFRTLESWIALLNNCSYTIVSTREPVHPITGNPASVIFTCQPLRV